MNYGIKQLLKTNRAEKTGQKYSDWYELQKIRLG